jgi:hypothetical protein
MNSNPADWLQAELDRRATEIRDQPPTPQDIARRNAKVFGAQIAPLFDIHTTTED